MSYIAILAEMTIPVVIIAVRSAILWNEMFNKDNICTITDTYNIKNAGPASACAFTT